MQLAQQKEPDRLSEQRITSLSSYQRQEQCQALVEEVEVDVEEAVGPQLGVEVDVVEVAAAVEEVLWMKVRQLRYVRLAPSSTVQKEKWSSN